jgi:hypothetical protein
MGLAYRISIYANEANWLSYEGFSTNYMGKAKEVHLTDDINFSPRNVMRVSDGDGSADFKVWKNGVMQDYITTVTPPYTYEAVGDKRHSLAVVGNTLEWTKPDGTVVRYARGTYVNAGSGGGFFETVYPNGFTVHSANDISSNTGFQLRGINVPDYRPMDKADNPNLIQAPPAGSSAGSGWSSMNPLYVKAINTAIEYCAPLPAVCAPTQSWPTATIEWPAGMPRTVFIGDSVVKVTDAGGAVTARSATRRTGSPTPAGTSLTTPIIRTPGRWQA